MKSQVEEAKREAADDYLRCPRCGDESELSKSAPYRYYVRCMSAECELESPYRITNEGALEWWTKRFDAGRDHSDEKVNCLHIRAVPLKDHTVRCDSCGAVRPIDGKWTRDDHSPESLREAVEMCKRMLLPDYTIPSDDKDALRTLLSAVRPSSWVSVEERLPTEAGWFLVTMDIGKAVIKMAFFDEEGFNTIAGYTSEARIVAWMPLPEPYQISGPQIEQEKP